MTRYFFPDETRAVLAASRGLIAANPGRLGLHEEPLFLTALQPHPGRQVGILSGGGSGHEPLHGGFVGQGMLDAAVPGHVFASPHNRQVYEASRMVAKQGGVLHIVKNYTGDIINFGIAAERLRKDGIAVERVVVADDLATESDTTATGRRGTGATVVVEKIVGAAADAGMKLNDLATLGQSVSDASRSIAVASRSLTSWHTGKESFELADETLEYGVGIHGERAQTSIPRPSNADLLTRMTSELVRAVHPQGDVILVVNGLGATTNLELYAILDHVLGDLTRLGIHAAAVKAGTLVSALDMRGFSLTITDVADQSWVDWWHAPTAAPGF